MKYCSILLEALHIDVQNKQELENCLQDIIPGKIIVDYIEMRQKLAKDFNLLQTTADWNNKTKIYRLIFSGENVDKFINKLTKKKEYIALLNSLSNIGFNFITIKHYDDEYQSILPEWFYKEKLLPGHYEKGIAKWHACDTEKLFEKNRKRQPSDWIYNTQEVIYKINKNGYRCPELDSIDWKNSIVLFGCSMTSSVGLSEENTLSNIMEEILGIPVISLGVSGSSPQFSFDNSIKLKQHFPEPLCVVHLWSEYSRTVQYSKSITHQGIAWGGGLHVDVPESHLAINAINYHNISKMLWKKYLAYSFFTSTSMLLDIPELPTVDFARDLIHYGTRTVRYSAERISKDVMKII